MKLYDAHIIFRNNKYDPVEIRGYLRSDIVESFVKFLWAKEDDGFMKYVLYHMDDIHEITIQTHKE